MDARVAAVVLHVALERGPLRVGEKRGVTADAADRAQPDDDVELGETLVREPVRSLVRGHSDPVLRPPLGELLDGVRDRVVPEARRLVVDERVDLRPFASALPRAAGRRHGRSHEGDAEKSQCDCKNSFHSQTPFEIRLAVGESRTRSRRYEARWRCCEG